LLNESINFVLLTPNVWWT